HARFEQFSLPMLGRYRALPTVHLAPAFALKKPHDEEHGEERCRQKYRRRDWLTETILVLFMLHPVVGVESILDADDSRCIGAAERRLEGQRSQLTARAANRLWLGRFPPDRLGQLIRRGLRAGEIDFE